MQRKPLKRAPPVLWQGKHLDGFLLVVMPEPSLIEGTLYAGEVEFKLATRIFVDSHAHIDTTVLANEFIKDLDREYLESEMIRMHKGTCDGTVALH